MTQPPEVTYNGERESKQEITQMLFGSSFQL
jgi:hypothetical protein